MTDYQPKYEFDLRMTSDGQRRLMMRRPGCMWRDVAKMTAPSGSEEFLLTLLLLGEKVYEENGE